MNRKLPLTVLSLIFIGAGLLSGFGCGGPTPSEQFRDAHQKLITLLKEDYELEVVTKEFNHSLWIYLPFEESFFSMKAKDAPSMPGSSSPETKPIIHFLEGSFTGNNFSIEYDIGQAKSYAKDPGYASEFSQEYQTRQRNILTAISRAYSDFEPSPDGDQLVKRVDGDIDFVGAKKNADHKRMVHSYVNTEKAPNIFVMVMADIKNGIEARVFIHLKDLKRAFIDPSFYEEYSRRAVSDQPFGDPQILGDKLGEHVDFHDVLMPEFLAKQIIYRINYKYTRSAFPPMETPREEILKAAAETVTAYGFTDFRNIVLKDLASGMAYTVGKEELAQYAPVPPSEPSEGRLIHIKFR